MSKIILGLVLIMLSCGAMAHTDYCEGFTVHDIRVVNGETWVEYSIVVHLGSPDLHMRSTREWKRKSELDCEI